MGIRRFTRLANNGLSRAASLPVQLLTLHSRARVVEDLSERMLTEVETPSGPIQFYCPSPLLTSRAETLLTKVPDTIKWIDSFSENSVFWDVGANVGVYSLYAAARSGVSVLSFEPLAANFHVLSRNIQLNDCSDRVTAYCVALSGVTELGMLNIASPKMGSALTQFGKLGEMSPYCDKGTNGSSHGMIGFTVDDFIDQFQPAFPNYMKLDVDGLEWSILQGAKKTLHDSRLRSLVVELSLTHDAERAQASSYLENCGFQLQSIGEGQSTSEGVGANHLFVRKTDR